MLLKEFQSLQKSDLVINKKTKRVYKVVDINRTTWQLRVGVHAQWASFSDYEVIKEEYLLKQIEKEVNKYKLRIKTYTIDNNSEIHIILVPFKQCLNFKFTSVVKHV